MKSEEIAEIVSQMTLEEKASLCSGKDFWHTKDIRRLGIREIMMADGPNGLRKQEGACDHLGVNESVEAVCFPTGSALGASFDREMLQNVGDILGNECRAESVAILLGPGVYMKRSPLCGRNFEYFSEDPYLASELAAAEIQGVQAHHIGCCIKHFLANNQEQFRMSISSEVDERTLREIYLGAFENAVKKGKPWSVMSSYNRINGEYVADSRKFLTEILREEWGFEGAVITDWGGVSDRILGLRAGLDLEMPSSYGVNDKRITEAVKSGELEIEILDEAIRRILKLITDFEEGKEKNAVFDREKDHLAAGEIAAQCAVLLKNEGILPLHDTQTVAFIGQYAFAPRYQGGGSSHINSFKVDSAFEILRGNPNVKFVQGYCDEDESQSGMLREEALQTASESDAAVIFAGLPDNYEIEGQDRTHMKMPEQQIRLIEEVARVNSNVAVVLHNGSPIEMPWLDKVNAVLEMYLGGEGCGRAACDLLYGKTNPSGRLAETFPMKLEDNPSYLYYHRGRDKAEYREGIYVGYRYYDTKNIPVLFPFGHGLSYTNFAYSNLGLSEKRITDMDLLDVTVDVCNTGSLPGKEVVLLFVAPPDTGTINRPAKELKEFSKVELKPGESRSVKFTLSKRAFAYYEESIHDWYVEKGKYRILICKSAQEVLLEGELEVYPEKEVTEVFDLTTPIGIILKDPVGQQVLGELMAAKKPRTGAGRDRPGEKDNGKMLEAMTAQLPLRALLSFRDMGIGHAKLQQIIDKINLMRSDKCVK